MGTVSAIKEKKTLEDQKRLQGFLETSDKAKLVDKKVTECSGCFSAHERAIGGGSSATVPASQLAMYHRNRWQCCGDSNDILSQRAG